MDDTTSFTAVSPSPTVSPWCSQDSGVTSAAEVRGLPLSKSTPMSSPPAALSLSRSMPMSSPIVNPLVAAGLVPLDLADILVTPSEDAAVSKERTKRITGARELTANEYTERLKEDQRKKKDAAEEKERKKEERKRKKEEATLVS